MKKNKIKSTSYWNYRIVKQGDEYGIKEVYYKNDKIEGWTEDFVQITADKTIKNILKGIIEKPILEEKMVFGKLLLCEIKK